ncbi:ABC transporter substrate-binding protein [Brevibacterium sp. 50QC2O2]|uniref:ABC transporter substrate-binding protein n=1 Tax=Brevibacterium sp. 50QC2O2 TaxID=2968459 RepID=UPI00211C4294|nr:ABC transporter substrate-binding protein [Brevibacterium sp. 50QC2O2]MCQ9388141.1 ABC transporter substrate-binding protein [Brevibacterium sp. 50QC2O2]
MVSKSVSRGHRALFGLTAALTATALGLSACTTGSGASGKTGKTDTIRTAMLADPNTFDPTKVSGVSAYQSGSLLYGTLVYQDPDDALAPGIASEFNGEPKHQEYTIREGLTCADGTPLTATVVKNSLDHFAKSGQKFLAFGPSTPKISADDDTRKVSVDLDVGWANAARGLTMVESAIVCPAGLEDPEGMAQGTVEGAFSGPYTLTDNKPGTALEFTLREDGYTFPEYKNELAGTPPKKINYAINGDQNAVANGLLTGTYDVANVSGEAMTRFDGKDGFLTERYPSATLFVLFNERPGRMMAKKENRVAVAQALNRKTFTQTTSGGLSDVFNSFVSDDVECAVTDDSSVIKQDDAAAKKVLAGQKIRLIGTQSVGPNGAGNSYVAQALEAVGAKVDVKIADNTTWAAETYKDSWDVTVMASLNLSRTMPGGLNPFVGLSVDDGGRNITGAVHQNIVDQQLAGMATDDAGERCKIYGQMQHSLNRDAVVIPLSAVTTQITSREGFKSIRANGTVPVVAMRITE